MFVTKQLYAIATLSKLHAHSESSIHAKNGSVSIIFVKTQTKTLLHWWQRWDRVLAFYFETCSISKWQNPSQYIFQVQNRKKILIFLELDNIWEITVLTNFNCKLFECFDFFFLHILVQGEKLNENIACSTLDETRIKNHEFPP